MSALYFLIFSDTSDDRPPPLTRLATRYFVWVVEYVKREQDTESVA